MALAIVITLEKDLSEAMAAYKKTGSGKALAREIEKLDFAARCRNITQPTSLISQNPDAVIAQLKEEGFDPGKMRIPPEEFFPAADGLKVIRTLSEYVTGKMNDFKQPNPILRDLKAAEALLSAAEAAGVRFHLTKTSL
jgi:hypothetical protein